MREGRRVVSVTSRLDQHGLVDPQGLFIYPQVLLWNNETLLARPGRLAQLPPTARAVGVWEPPELEGS